MIVHVVGTSASGETSRADARVTRDGAVELRVDGTLLFRVPEEEWGLFCEAMLGTGTLPPSLSAPKWATHGLGIAFLGVGERLQALHALIQLACVVPLDALFHGADFGPARAAAAFVGRRFHDGLGDLLYVPEADVQARLAARHEEAEAMLRAGCLFEAGVAGERGDAAAFFFRPCRPAPARPEWPQGLRELREAVEEARQGLAAAR